MNGINIMADELDDIFEQEEEVVVKKPVTSFNQDVSKPKVSTTKKYIRKETVIDKFSVKRERVELSPTMCTKPHCSFDIAKKNNLDWNRLSESKKQELLEALEAHVQEAHSVSEDVIIDQDQMPTNWLGGKQKVF